MNTASFDLKFIRAVGFLFDSHSDHFKRIVFHSQIKPFFVSQTKRLARQLESDAVNYSP